MALVVAIAPASGVAQEDETDVPKPFIVAFDPETGAEQWRKVDSDSGIWQVLGESHGAVFVHEIPCGPGPDGSSDVVARDIRTGRVRWRQAVEEIGAPFSSPWSGTEFSVAGGTLVLWDFNVLRGLDPETGQVVWEEPLDGLVPVAGTDELVLLTQSFFDRPSELRGVDRETGEIKWTYPSNHDHLAQARVTLARSEAAILELQGPGGRQASIDLRTGRELWDLPNDDLPVDRVNLGADDGWSLLFASFVDGRVGPLRAYHPRTREERWIAPLTVSDVSAMTGHLVVTSVYGSPNRYVALDAATGKIEWERDSSGSSIVAAGHGLLVEAPRSVGERGDAVAFEAKTGETRWRVATPDGGGRRWLIGSNVYVSGGCIAADA